MTHLSNEEIIAVLDGSAASDAHLRACESCRTRVEELRQIVASIAQADVPEPSPLFWEHFSGRVREAVASDPQPWVSAWPRGFGWTAGVIGTLAVIVIGVMMTIRG